MKYLIYRNDGIGDLIVTTPFIVSLRILDKKSDIYLVCSKRNYLYAKILLKNKLVNEIILSVDKGKNFYDLYKLSQSVFKIKPDYSIILKSSNTNFLSALFHLRSKIIGTIYVNDNNKETPNRLLQRFFYKNEKIDCRNNYQNSSNILMKDHYKSLFNKTFSSNKDLYQNKYFTPLLANINRICNFNIKEIEFKKSILIHLDEKWSRYKLDVEEINKLIEKLQSHYDFIIITTGIEYINHNLNLFKKYAIDQEKDFVRKDNLIFFNKLGLANLINLISKTNTIITSEGGISHIAASFGKNLVNLIEENKIYFLNKWKPEIINYHHLIVKRNNITEDILRYLKIN